MKEEKHIKICPKCGSTDVHVDFSNHAVWAYGTPTNYQCESCGHISNVFPEVPESEIKSFQSILKREIGEGNIITKKEPLVDTKSGFNSGYLEMITLLLIITFVVFMLGSYITGIILLVVGAVLIKWRNDLRNKKNLY